MKIAIKIVLWALTGALLAIMTALLLLKIFGYTPYSVVSGSMEPTYNVGSMVFVKEIPTADIQSGDSISFVMDKSLNVATHRVTKVSNNGEYFYTKGDANMTADAMPVYYKNVLGKVDFAVPLAGYVSMWVTSPIGKACFIVFLAVLVALSMADRFLTYKHQMTTATAVEQSGGVV